MVELEPQIVKTKQNTIKIVLIGDQAVGKSSLLMRYVDKKFALNMMGTAGVDIKKKVIDYNNQKIISSRNKSSAV